MTDLKVVMDAIQRIESGESLDDAHYKAIKPMFSILKDRLAPEGKIPFKHVAGGYFVASVFFSHMDGLEYIQRIIQQGSVSAIVLWSRDSLGPDGALIGPVEAGLFDYDESSIDDEFPAPNAYQPAESQKIFEVRMAQKMLARIDELNAEPATPGRDRTVRFLEDELRRHRYKRDIKSFNDEGERARKAVEGAIRRAIAKLMGCQETKNIGLYLKETIKPGATCEYMGDPGKWGF